MKPACGLLLNPRIYFLIFTFVIAFAFANTSSVPKTGTLTGKVYDAALNQPLAYVNVLLLLLLLNEALKP